MNPEIVGNKLLLDGFLYNHCKYGNNGRRHWEWQRIRSKECKARAITNFTSSTGNIVVYKGPTISPYAHPTNHDECEAERIKVSLK